MPAEIARRTICLVVVVWGDDYIDTFLNLALPSFLAEGNLPACAASADLVFQIYTTPEGAARIESHPLVHGPLHQCTTLRIRPILTPDQFENRNRYAVMAFCHRYAILDALNARAILSILSPDCIAGNGSIASAWKHIERGAQAVLVAGPRAVLETAGIQLTEFVCPDGSLCVPNSDLVRVLMNCLHPISERLFWNAPQFSKVPSAIYWRAGPDSMLVKYFHLHPLMVDLANAASSAADAEGTVDGPLLKLARIPESGVHVVTASDDIAIIELSRFAHDWMGWASPPSRSALALRWAMVTTDDDHRLRFFKYDIFLRGNMSADFPAAQRQSKRDLLWLRLGLAGACRWPRLYFRLDTMARMAAQLPSRLRGLSRRLVGIFLMRSR